MLVLMSYLAKKKLRRNSQRNRRIRKINQNKRNNVAVSSLVSRTEVNGKLKNKCEEHNLKLISLITLTRSVLPTQSFGFK